MARHITTVDELISSYNGSLDDDARQILIGDVPDYDAMVETNDLGLYLK